MPSGIPGASASTPRRGHSMITGGDEHPDDEHGEHRPDDPHQSLGHAAEDQSTAADRQFLPCGWQEVELGLPQQDLYRGPGQPVDLCSQHGFAERSVALTVPRLLAATLGSSLQEHDHDGHENDDQRHRPGQRSDRKAPPEDAEVEQQQLFRRQRRASDLALEPQLPQVMPPLRLVSVANRLGVEGSSNIASQSSGCRYWAPTGCR